MSELLIRPATHEDAPRIAEIYNHYVQRSTVTFDAEPRSAEDRIRWLDSHDSAHPVLVGMVDGQVLVWGSLSKWNPRGAYRHSVEISVYVDSDALGRGIGQGMAEALIAEAEAFGHHAIISQIVADNSASLSLAERTGFERVGVLREVGRKFDRWLDVVLYERVLVGPYEQRH